MFSSEEIKAFIKNKDKVEAFVKYYASYPPSSPQLLPLPPLPATRENELKGKNNDEEGSVTNR